MALRKLRLNGNYHESPACKYWQNFRHDHSSVIKVFFILFDFSQGYVCYASGKSGILWLQNFCIAEVFNQGHLSVRKMYYFRNHRFIRLFLSLGEKKWAYFAVLANCRAFWVSVATLVTFCTNPNNFAKKFLKYSRKKEEEKNRNKKTSKIYFF